jgi:MATE family multidrug resistance protein
VAYSWTTYRTQYGVSLKLAYPVMVGQLGQILVSVADSIMVGKFLGTIPLAAISLAVSILIIPMVFAIGVAFGLTPLIAGADGADDPKEAVKYFKNGLVLNSVLGLLVYGVLAFFAQFAHLLGQDERVVSEAMPYLHIVGFSIVPMMAFFAFKQFAEGLSDTKAGMRVSLVANLLNILLNYPLITGWGPFPELGLAGAAVSTLATRFLMVAGMAIYIRKHRKFASYWSHWRSTEITWRSIRDILAIGVPSGLQLVFEAGAFAMSGVIVGMIGPVQQAAHQIALNIASVSYMMVSGLGAAATIRVGNQLGKRDIPMLRLAGQSLFHLTLAMMVLTMILLIGLRNFLPEFYSSDPEVYCNTRRTHDCRRNLPIARRAAGYHFRCLKRGAGCKYSDHYRFCGLLGHCRADVLLPRHNRKNGAPWSLDWANHRISPGFHSLVLAIPAQGAPHRLSRDSRALQ